MNTTKNPLSKCSRNNRRDKHSVKCIILNAAYRFILSIFVLFLLVLYSDGLSAQPEVTAWGNMKGIRVDGQLMAIETSLCVVGPGWSGITQTAKERQLPCYSREGNKQIISTRLGKMDFTEVVEDSGSGTAQIDVQFTSGADTNITGVFLCIDLPARDYADGTIQITGQPGISFGTIQPNDQDEYIRTTFSGS